MLARDVPNAVAASLIIENQTPRDRAKLVHDSNTDTYSSDSM